jgi:superfamily II DNA or RNA helicase
MKFEFVKDKEILKIVEAEKLELQQLKLWLNRYVKGYLFDPRFKRNIWDGKETLYNKDSSSVAMGLWKECINSCNQIGAKFEIVNKKDFPINREVTLESVTEFCKDFFKDHLTKDADGNWIPFMPYDYQIDTAYKILKNRYCTTEVATSGGKSLILSIVFMYIQKYFNPDVKMLFIVPSISLVTQFYDDIYSYYYGEQNVEKGVFDYQIEFELANGERYEISPNDEVTVLTTRNKELDKFAYEVKENDLIYINGSFFPLSRIIHIKKNSDLRIVELMSDKPRNYMGEGAPNVYIGCYQTLIKYPPEYFKQFYCVAIDEAHKCTGHSIKTIAEHTFGNATYRFGVSGTFPKDESYEILLVQYVTGAKVAKITAKTLMDKGRITPVQIFSLLLNHNEKELNKKLKQAKTKDNGTQILNYEKKWVQDSEKRINFIDNLIRHKCNDNTMILFHNIEYGKKIYEKLKENEDIEVYYIAGEINATERNEIIKEMKKTNKKKVLVSSFGTTATGLSISAIYNLILADSFKSDSLITQAIGRVLRKFKGKEIATVYDLVDILDIEAKNNMLFRQYIERTKIYDERQYPYKEINIVLK